jgi:branched-chain amino acid transport system permease protein
MLANLDTATVAVLFLNGLVGASTLFIVASGLSIIFGVTRIVNFAHGSFYMLGAFIAYTLVTTLPRTPLGFWGGVLVAAVAVGVIGALMEMVVLRRIYRAPELFQLLATFGVVLAIQDLALKIWGPEELLGPRVPGLRGAVDVLGKRFPEYNLALIAIGLLVFALLWLLFHRTRWGVLVRAATQDREMVAALGVNQKWLFTGVFFLGSMLAGLGGALQVPRDAANLAMDLNVIAEAFVVVVVGGMGSVGGAFLAALLIGVLQAFGILIFPKLTLVLVFLVMAAVLVARPYGLLGRAEGAQRGVAHAQPMLVPADGAARLLAAVTLALLAAAPLVASEFALVTLTETLIFVLFATSLHFLMGPAGMVSFGHAAYFGLGAYAVGLGAKFLGLPMVAGLLAGPLIGGLGALAFGWFVVRLSGVYLAMLTLAFAQIVWSIAFQWFDVTGGDNGILGLRPATWLGDRAGFYWLTLVLCVAGVAALRGVVFAPFGYALRAGRDSPLRADAIGVDLRRFQWLGFTLAGVGAGLAGALYAYAQGSVFPNAAAIPLSVDGLVMVLLGGIQTLAGPIVGAAVFHTLQVEILRLTDLWRLILGGTLILLVLAFPQGIAGWVGQRWAARRGPAA